MQTLHTVWVFRWLNTGLVHEIILLKPWFLHFYLRVYHLHRQLRSEALSRRGHFFAWGLLSRWRGLSRGLLSDWLLYWRGLNGSFLLVRFLLFVWLARVQKFSGYFIQISLEEVLVAHLGSVLKDRRHRQLGHIQHWFVRFLAAFLLWWGRLLLGCSATRLILFLFGPL